MKAALLIPLVALVACKAAPAPRPMPRVTDRAEVRMVQVGWMQLTSGRPNRPPVDDLRRGRTPDPVEAQEIADSVLDKCRKGAAMESLQRDYSEAQDGTLDIDAQTRAPYRDAALALSVGECALVHGNAAHYIVKRIN